jgi:hypothetical protein
MVETAIGRSARTDKIELVADWQSHGKFELHRIGSSHVMRTPRSDDRYHCRYDWSPIRRLGGIMTRAKMSEEILTLDEERVALRIHLHLLREQGGDPDELAAGEARLTDLSKTISALIARKP